MINSIVRHGPAVGGRRGSPADGSAGVRVCCAYAQPTKVCGEVVVPIFTT